jgi:hypothetical protein
LTPKFYERDRYILGNTKKEGKRQTVRKENKRKEMTTLS